MCSERIHRCVWGLCAHVASLGVLGLPGFKVTLR